jgi:hypothetical protein
MNRLGTLGITTLAAACLVLGACSDIQNREDFASQIKNKTEPEVLKFAGKPANVDSTNPARVAWVYKARTFDVPTRTTDAETDVIFTPGEDGKLHVAEVQFK